MRWTAVLPEAPGLECEVPVSSSGERVLPSLQGSGPLEELHAADAFTQAKDRTPVLHSGVQVSAMRWATMLPEAAEAKSQIPIS